mmetsp:Transcript_17457/g.30776  ORF Transcript_17457/g.30776 Transcript_17457/m.30776 type:complete len:212 (+) Transcript_17457:640-1275(+)
MVRLRQWLIPENSSFALSASLVLAISSGYINNCDMIPAPAPATNRSDTCMSVGSFAYWFLNHSYDTNFVADSGIILMTLVPFPFQKLYAPPSLYIFLSPDKIERLSPWACACIISFSLSIGAVIVRETAPAMPPATKFTKYAGFPPSISSGMVGLSPVSTEALRSHVSKTFFSEFTGKSKSMSRNSRKATDSSRVLRRLTIFLISFSEATT